MRKFKKKLDSNTFIEYIDTTDEGAVKASPDAKSETIYIKLLKSKINEDIYLCDSPGF
jgi:hypothetical protein